MVDNIPGKQLAFMVKLDVTNAASPMPSNIRMIRLAIKNSLLVGIRSINLKRSFFFNNEKEKNLKSVSKILESECLPEQHCYCTCRKETDSKEIFRTKLWHLKCLR